MKETDALVSVVIPVYNVEKYLRECLDSVLAQTYQSYEVILVDDGSTDSSHEICREYCARDSRFCLYRQENSGASRARNNGMSRAQGDYIFFLDSDDSIDSRALEKLVAAAAGEKSDFVFSEAEAFDDTTGKTYNDRYSYHKDYYTGHGYLVMREMAAHKEFHLAIWGILISKPFLDAHKLSFEEGIVYEDMIFSCQLYTLADRATHLHEVIYHRRYRENSVMTSKKSARNFVSAHTVYKKVTEFYDGVPSERRCDSHIIRCAYSALNDYRALSGNDKKKYKAEYRELKKDIISRGAFGDPALRSRCIGYPFWVLRKAAQKLFRTQKPDYSVYISPQQNDRRVMMLIPHMVGGGAERVAAQLMNQMYRSGIDVKLVLSADRRSEVVRSDLDTHVPLWLLREEMPKESLFRKSCLAIAKAFSNIICKPFELLKLPVPAAAAKCSQVSNYSAEIRFIRGMMKAEPDLTVIAFLQPTIPIALLAARGLPNRVIISERADPNRLMKKRYGKKFIEKYYPRADAAVFQTEDARSVYPKSVADKGTVIPNPLKPGLPEPYRGERNRNITTFCRISKQKNLPLLVEAFSMLHRDFPEYRLRIIGDAVNREGEEVTAVLKKRISELDLSGCVSMEPFSADVHRMILKDAMYVNSSDFEGISNAMLEAMAVGMPVVCTDCPIGGAKATVEDGVNGLLVPIDDAKALYIAMKRIAEDDGLSSRLSQNAARLSKELDIKDISKRWEALI